MVVLSGRFAGRKAVVLRVYEEGSKEKPFARALVVGISKAPRKVTKAMDAEAVAKRLKVYPFVKTINLQHVMPTRYNLDISEQLEKILGDSDLTDSSSKDVAKTALRQKLEERYKSQADAAGKGGKSEKYAEGVKYFFRKLNF